MPHKNGTLLGIISIFITKQMTMSFSKPKIDTTPIYSESPLKRKPKVIDKNKYTKYGVKKRAHWDEFDYYKQQVKELTEVNCKQLKDIDKRGFTSYHIDHKISIKYGFDNNIPIEHISDISNLVMLWCKDNIKKSKDCIIDESNSWIMKTQK